MSFDHKTRKNSGKFLEFFMSKVFLICALVSIGILSLITIFLLSGGIPAMAEIGFFNFLTGDEWRPDWTPQALGILPMILGSLFTTAGAILIGVPIGIFTAVFLAYFCPKPIYRILKPAINLLAGIPSVVYGFFGAMVIVPLLRGPVMNYTGGGTGRSLLAASILLGIMILPTIITISETAIRAVPKSYHEGALALGASKTRAVFKAVLPAAKSGIFASFILGVGRAIGETMAVILVAGNQPRMPIGEGMSFFDTIFGGLRTLTVNVQMELNYAYGLHRGALIATGVVLLIFILTINVVFNIFNRKRDYSRMTLMARAKQKFWTNAWVGNFVGNLKFSQRFHNFMTPIRDKVVFVATWAFAAITLSVLLFIIFHILSNGIPHLTLDLFRFENTWENQSMMPSIIATLVMVIMTLAMAVPVGIFTGIYLVEYTKRGNKVVKIIRTATEMLASIPSIVFGLFGFLFFVVFAGLGYSLLGGSLTLMMMILPLIIRTTEEALKSVPDGYREGAFALGSGKLRMVFKAVLPSAVPGILAGVILATGRIVGETAALVHTAGAVARIPTGLDQSVRTLSVHMWTLSNEGQFMPQAYATAVVILVIVLVINMGSAFLAKKLSKG